MHFFYPGRPHAHRVAACDDDPTDGISCRALTHPKSTPPTIVWTKKGSTVLRLPAFHCTLKPGPTLPKGEWGSGCLIVLVDSERRAIVSVTTTYKA
jgi:hypothetical protein